MAEYEVAHPVNIDESCFAPVNAGCWQQHELWDGTYCLDDLWDVLEMLTVRAENEKRARDAMMKK